MKLAYFDCSHGISGDMFIGALLSAGAPFAELQRELAKLRMQGVEIESRSVLRKGLAATKFDVRAPHERAGHGWTPLGWGEMSGIIMESALAGEVRKTGLGIIKSLFEAEAGVHGHKRIEDVHLHELGSADTVLDVIGAVVCLRLLGVDEVRFSPVNLGGGQVDTLHGRYGVPAPATALLLEGVPVYGGREEERGKEEKPFELTTPTGAALIKGLAAGFGPMPSMRLEKTGAGAGQKDPETFPNVLRVFLGETHPEETAGRKQDEEILVIETNLDDMNPQVLGYLAEELLKAGALDAFLTPVIMKKGRPAVKLTVLCDDSRGPLLKEKIFSETTTLGVRFYHAGRNTVERKVETGDTEFGPVRFKTCIKGGRRLKAPEYEDCAHIARETGLPLMEVLDRLKSRPGENKNKKT